MEKCPECKIEKQLRQALKCKFCSKSFCSLPCLTKHTSHHKSNNSDFANNVLLSLKKKQTLNLANQYPFLTEGVYTYDFKYKKELSFQNFTKVTDGFLPVELGIGSYGRVYLVTHNETGEKYSLKVIDKKKLSDNQCSIDLIYNEINIQSKLNHENIIRLYNVYETETEINIILEYASKGNLYNLILKNKNGFSEFQAYQYFIQVVNAVYFLHQNAIIHRDIKPENILISDNEVLKLCDFGWAKEVSVENRSTFCGTIEYMAPEIVDSEKYDFGVDIWSLGILLYELLMGYSPFKAKDPKNIMVNIKYHELTFDKNKNLSDECRSLIKSLLEVNPQKRIKIRDIFEHPFIKKYSLKLYRNTININNDINILNSNNNKKKLRKSDIVNDNLSINEDKKTESEKNEGEIFSSKNIVNWSKLLNKKDKGRMKKFADNLQSEMNKAINKINNLSYKKTQTLSFEDFRDSNLLDDEDTNNNNNNDNKNSRKNSNDNKEIKESTFDDTFEDIPEERPSSMNIKPY